MRLLLASLLLLGSVTVACSEVAQPEAFEPGEVSSGETDSPTPAKAKTTKAKPAPSGSAGSAPDRPAPTPAPAPAPAASPSNPFNPSAADTTWTGTLAKSNAVGFGGSPYCDYRTHLENVAVRVTIAADGTVKSADVTATAIEEGLNGCPNAPIVPNHHDYALTTPATATFNVEGAEQNLPRAKMSAQLTAEGTNGSIALTWHRDDIDAPFDWTISATVPLQKQ